MRRLWRRSRLHDRHFECLGKPRDRLRWRLEHPREFAGFVLFRLRRRLRLGLEHPFELIRLHRRGLRWRGRRRCCRRLEHPGELAGFVLFRGSGGCCARVLRLEHASELTHLFCGWRSGLASFCRLEHVGEFTGGGHRSRRLRRRRMGLRWRWRNARFRRRRVSADRLHLATELGYRNTPVPCLREAITWRRRRGGGNRTNPIRESHCALPRQSDDVSSAFVLANFYDFAARRLG